eukprot:TRINITY_DN205_c0_g1_i1.p3 TRINITY_DN205_c0_g1~~TRINITY_DN205_c0_g1_i1.p3  ORF type:complete len:132 (-),score=14.78 TRINITY_DN205_c0_g1_i1:473-868(-)
MAFASQVTRWNCLNKSFQMESKFVFVPVSQQTRKRAKLGQKIITCTLQQQADEEQTIDEFSTSFADAKDFWEGEQWEWIGTFGKYFLPLIVLLFMVLGGIAAITYQEKEPAFVQATSSNHQPVAQFQRRWQ